LERILLNKFFPFIISPKLFIPLNQTDMIMKTRILFFMLVITFVGGLSAQNASEYFTIRGVVKDSRNHKDLENVCVSLSGTNKGTVTNKEGTFSLKVVSNDKNIQINFSHLGYLTGKLVVNNLEKNNKHTVYLRQIALPLREIIVTPIDAQKIVEEAMSKVAVNYPNYPTMLTAFYRETIRKKKHYISVCEAVIKIYKTSYTNGNDSRERVRILKGRKILSQNLCDTLSVKLQGGPTQGTALDLVKTAWPLLEEENLGWYKFSFVEYVVIDGRFYYKIHFEPIVERLFPLMSGNYYIDRETLAFERMELVTDMRDNYKVTEQVLAKKPIGMRFNPQELSYLISYKTVGPKTYLNYIRSTLRFQCDWKRKMFHTNYIVVAETAVTDREDNPTENIHYRNAFRIGNVLSDKIENFQDSDFWEGYNIIEPTESLEDAVVKLKKNTLKSKDN